MQFVFRERQLPSINDSCQMARTNSVGQCKFIEDCPIAQNEIRNNRVFPQLCGFFNSTKEMICCPKSQALKTINKVRISQKSNNYCPQTTRYSMNLFKT